jgi:DNA-binding PadR family transcriptional regulator
MFRYLVLGLLRRGEPLHGYALMKEYRERAGVQISTGSFYRELARLVTEGLVRTASNPPGSDPRRAPYEITDLGATSFDAWFSEPLGTDAGPHEDGLSARAVFLAEAGPAAARPALERWYDELVRGQVGHAELIEPFLERFLLALRDDEPPPDPFVIERGGLERAGADVRMRHRDHVDRSERVLGHEHAAHGAKDREPEGPDHERRHEHEHQSETHTAA